MGQTGALEEDVLAKMKKIHSIFTKGIFPYITIAVYLVNITVIGVNLLVLLSTYKVTLWEQFSPFLFGGFTVIVGYATFEIGKKYFIHIYCEILPKLKSYRDMDAREFKIIKFQAKVVETWIGLAIISMSVTTIVSQPFYGDDYETIFPIKLFVEYLGKFSIFASVLFFEHFFYGGFLMVANAATFLYVSMHLKFQLSLLSMAVNKMTKPCEILADVNLIKDENFQKKVCQDLIVCIKHHQLIIELNNKFNEYIHYPCLGFTISSIISVASLIYTVILDVDRSFNSTGNIGVIMMATVTMQLLAVFIYGGQVLLSESEQTYNSIKKLPWYCYNTKNRMLLLIFMQKSQFFLKLSSSGLITIEFSLMIKIVRNVYSLLTFLVSTQ